jgi:pSer/pThr/pTyr-binding forkhead associated (FHA) protein
MKVTVEVRNGSRRGHRVWLASHQDLRVGKTEWSDFVVPDPVLGDVQFVLNCSSDGCTVVNLEPKSPLYVNGKPVQSQSLVDGDIIRAGQTDFRVLMSEKSSSEPPRVDLVWKRDRTEDPIPYFIHHGRSGVMSLVGDTVLSPPEKLVAQLKRRFAIYEIVNTSRLGGEEDFSNERAISDIAIRPDDVLEDDLRLLGPQAEQDRLQIARRLWGQNALTILITGQEPPELLELLDRNSFLLSHPRTLVKRFLHGASDVLQECFSSLVGVLLELDEKQWGLFTTFDERSVWQVLGFPPPPSNTRGTEKRLTDTDLLPKAETDRQPAASEEKTSPSR